VYLLDTNICIDFIDGRSADAQRRVRENFPKGLHASTVTVGELLVGSKTSDDPDGDKIKVERFLSIITIHDFDRNAADAYAEIVQAIGLKRVSFDRLIAAHAVALGLTLVTNNQKHFADVPGLKVENWTVM
jgi:tRNA(fMet)-specific endonuclease VapC